MNSTEREEMARDEQDIARILQAVGPREAMPEDLKARWEQQFRAELKPVVQQRRSRRYSVMGMAASVVAVGLVTLLSLQTPKIAPLSVQVVSVVGDIRVTRSDNSTVALTAGESLSLNDAITSGNASAAALNYRGYDLRLNGSSHLQLVPEGIALESGEIYVSNEAAKPQSEGITVITRFGTIEDIGTQFIVSVNENGAVSTVRRGTIVVTTDVEKIRAEATADNAREISFDGAHQVQLTDKPAAGPGWEWIYSSTPAFALEGQTVDAFLQWSSRESGMRLEYSSKSAKTYASVEILSANITLYHPERQMETIMSSTHLQVERKAGNTLQVTLRERN